MKTYSEFIVEARLCESNAMISKMGRATGKLLVDVGKSATKTALRAVRDYGKQHPKGTKRRAVADVLDAARNATLSDKERTRRRKEAEKKQRRVDREVSKARKEREKSERPTQNRGRYRNTGAGTTERVASQSGGTYRNVGAGTKEKASSGSYTPPKATQKTKAPAKKKRSSKLDDLLSSIRDEN